MIFNTLRIFILLINLTLCHSRTYDNYTLYDLYLNERFKIQFLQNLENKKYMDVIFWQRPFKLHSHIQVLVNPRHDAPFNERLQHFAIDGNVLSRNVQNLFDQQKTERYIRTRPETYTWNLYHRLEDIYQWMTDLSYKNRGRVYLKTIGKSTEGREILALEFRPFKAKAAVVIEGAIHGSEWLSTEFVTYLANELANVDKTSEVKLKKLVNDLLWILIPVVNPDGYVYSQNSDRLWYKNRRSLKNKRIGIDLNKNFGYSFCTYDGSTDINDEDFCGPAPFSEPETLAIHQVVKNITEPINYYFSIRSYGQTILLPYSDRINHIDNFADMENYGKQAIMKMYKMNGVKYSIGTIYDVYGYRSSGNSVSWVKRYYRVKYAMTFFLRDNGTYGHALPPFKILPTCREALTGLVEVMTAKPKYIKLSFNAASTLETMFCFLIFLILINFV